MTCLVSDADDSGHSDNDDETATNTSTRKQKNGTEGCY